jgi:Ca2+-binding RTX toxin-like protein
MAMTVATTAVAQGVPDRPGINGTNNAEVLFGSSANNTISGYAGGDYINGLEGDDEIFAGDGADLVIGESGEDFILGGRGGDYIVTGYAYFQVAPNAPASPDFVGAGPGDDIIDSADLAGAPDTVYCGTGTDVVYAGVEDFVAPGECEYVYRYEGF